MTLAAAMTVLGSTVVAGVRHYGIGQVPGPLNPGQLPALISLPLMDEMEHLRFSEVQVEAASAATLFARHYVTEILLFKTAGMAGYSAVLMNGLVALMDTYAAARKGDLLLDGNLIRPLRYVALPMPIEWCGCHYYGCRFHLTLDLGY